VVCFYGGSVIPLLHMRDVNQLLTNVEFLTNIVKTHTCWLWIGELNTKGYGRYKRKYFAHRVSFYLVHKRLSKDKMICHRCNNPSCVRPDHLFEGNASDNARDAYYKGKLNITNISKDTQFKSGNRVNNIGPIDSCTVIEIRKLYSEGITQVNLAKQYGFTRNVIWKIVNNKSYTHLL
jgi:hypothetical protein